METPQPQDELGLHLKRPCLVISDLARSLTLYRDILGFTLDYQSEASPDSYLYRVFRLPQKAQLVFASLSTQYEPRAISFVEVKGIELPSPSVPHRAAIVIRVPQLAPTIEKIVTRGLEIVEPNTFNAPPNLHFTEQGFWDEDGHLIVLYDIKMLDDCAD
ncbi:VOC family protein [Lusitaniella coriacea]|uniref:VOC family protein n=1 Tax=Lusitaniella coriacea TaxID=1983105 RepID=UPI003CF7A2F0